MKVDFLYLQFDNPFKLFYNILKLSEGMSVMSPEKIEKKTQEVWDTLNSKKFSQTDIFLAYILN